MPHHSHCSDCGQPLRANAWHPDVDARGQTIAARCCACHHLRALAPILSRRPAMAHTTRAAAQAVA